MDAERDEKVHERAYAIWEREGRPEGGAERHWAEAEEELRAEEQGGGRPVRRSRRAGGRLGAGAWRRPGHPDHGRHATLIVAPSPPRGRRGPTRSAPLKRRTPPGGPGGVWSSSARPASAGGRQLLGRALAVVAAHELVPDAIALAERVHAGALDGGGVDEGVGVAVLGLDEAVALVGVEPLDRTGLQSVTSRGA